MVAPGRPAAPALQRRRESGPRRGHPGRRPRQHEGAGPVYATRDQHATGRGGRGRGVGDGPQEGHVALRPRQQRHARARGRPRGEAGAERAREARPRLVPLAHQRLGALLEPL
ncbi:MAG: hypothetical protein ACK559_23065, partial [bacterium]